MIYHENVACEGPAFKSMKVEGGKIRVSFDNVGSGLVDKGRGTLGGFSVAGEDGVYRYARAVIDGNTVVVASDLVPAPRSVRYAWAGNPAADLGNKEGLPAAPFRTDKLPVSDLEIHTLPAARTVKTPRL